MRFNVSDKVPLSADEVFTLLRDEMPKLVPFLHDVDGIDVLSRDEDGDDGETVRIVNLWRGSMKNVPGPARRFVKPDLVTWKDHAVWTTSNMTASWRLEPRLGGGIFECSGTTRIVRDGDTARLELQGDLEIHSEKVPGVPRLLARKLRGTIENVIVGQLKPNMENLAVSIRAYAAAK